MDNFPNGVASFGGPVLPFGGIVPTIPPVQGAPCYFVDGTHGNDGNLGTSPTSAFKTLDYAYGKTTSGYNQIVYVIGGASSVNFSSAIASGGAGLVWANSETHLIGLCGPGSSGMRAHISNGASTNLYTPMIEFRGSGCLVQNVEIFNGGAHATEAAVAVLVTGSYNAFVNCQISGGGHATSAADNSCRSLVLTGNGTGGGGENTFRHCYIGLTTVPRGGTAAELEMTAHTPRNWFEDCSFAGAATVSTAVLVKIGTGGIQDFVVFRGNLFINPGTSHGGQSIYAQALSCAAAPDGVVMMHDNLSGGATVCFTKFQSTASAVVFGDNPGSAASTYGIAATS